MVALATAPVAVKYRRANEAEEELIRTEEQERWCLEVARRERAKKRRTSLLSG